MSFVGAVVIVLVILSFVLVATCAHLLARIIRLEGAVRGLSGGSTDVGPGLRVDAPLPDAVAREVNVAGTGRAVRLHVVSPGCQSCRGVVEALCNARPNGVEHRIVVGHEADVALFPDECTVPMLVAPELVRTLVMAGWRLPVRVTTRAGMVIAIEAESGVGV
jgi:hypothetical protein